MLIGEVGPRAGLQSVQATMPTAAQRRWIAALAAAGLREIEVASFVPPRLLPQMADAAEVVAHVLTMPGLTMLALAPNRRGADAALAAGVHTLTLPVPAGEAHSMANVRRTCAGMLDERAPGVAIEVTISTAFGCTLQGAVDDGQVIRLAVQAAEAGAGDVGVSDTTGRANPAQVRRRFMRLRRELGARAGAAQRHIAHGLGPANGLAARDVGPRSFDASLGGLGGCPCAPGASGNVVTDDLVFMFEAMGVRTGVELARPIAARTALAEGPPGEPLGGMTPEAGLAPGVVQGVAHG